ncbi:WXG100 family type VII secretion target [Paenibacillus turpanensis]|uniref:WXG100 family type VII secretion target n=1 Tax=Paenibacillus turpanensis TaxID=2689078 RepID=UPI001409D5F3|nr:WXG100 family type VII secretion target [Paenibacillus turpanensis]
MAELKLSYEGLRNQGNVVARKHESFETLIADVKRIIEDLDTVWSDKAASDFKMKVQQMDPTFRSFGELLDNLSKHMIKVADNYSQLSENIVQSQNNF